jgi:hypothetical protein
VLATVNSGTLATVGLSGYYDHQTVSVVVPANLAPGTYYIGGIADDNHQISESSETNNTYNVVQITVSARSGSATSAHGESVDNFAFVTNFGGGPSMNGPPPQDHGDFHQAGMSDIWHILTTTDAREALFSSVEGDMPHLHLSDFHIV